MPTTNAHPVDSTYHPCCNAIGRLHARDCAPNVPIPAGATSVGAWDDGGRLFHGSMSVIKPSGWLREDVRITTGGVQHADGTHEWEIVAGPLHPDSPLTAAQARQIGEALIAAADELDGLSAGDQ